MKSDKNKKAEEVADDDEDKVKKESKNLEN